MNTIVLFGVIAEKSWVVAKDEHWLSCIAVQVSESLPVYGYVWSQDLLLGTL